MSELIKFKSIDGQTSLEVSLEDETVWLTQKQMGNLFDKSVKTINEHIKNIFKEKELEENSVTRKFRISGSDGKTYNTNHYTLDVIISVGYRVKSKRGTEFRRWANTVLKEYLIKGYAINENRYKEKVSDMQKAIELLNSTINNQIETLDEAKSLIKVINDYAYALTILDEYDLQTISIKNSTKKRASQIDYDEAMDIINNMRDEFTSPLFGNEKDDSFKSALGAIFQTAFGEEVYPSIEEKSANLLYFIIKNHAFTDGNKRIAAAIFIYFMHKNRILYNQNGAKKLADNALVALTLMIAESKPDERDTIIKVVVNLINSNN